jgi:hypothetical protein
MQLKATRRGRPEAHTTVGKTDDEALVARDG